VLSDYFTQAESHFSESHFKESQVIESHFSESHFEESQVKESQAAASLLAVLLPQEAKEMAAKAANTKTNFFITFLFKSVKQSLILYKSGRKGRYFLNRLYHFGKVFLEYIKNYTY